MKYLKYFKTDVDYQNYFNSDDFVTPNVSYVEDTNIVYYKPIKSIIYATYLATDDNKLAIANTSNVKSLKVNGNNVSFGNTYYFESNGKYEVEIELIDDSIITGVIYDENWNMSSSMFWDSENEIGSCLTSITIPNSVTSIGESAFSDCSSLTSITIPDSVTSIGRRAFSYCSSLTSITIPNSVTSIGESAFYGCKSLPVENNLRYVGTYLVGVADKSLSTYTIKEGTKWIGEEAFDSCTGLTSITIPDSVTSIEEYAFYGCSNLNEITCLATTAPSIMSNTFGAIKSNGLLRIPAGSDYSSWMNIEDCYLGYYNWHIFTGDDFIIMTRESNQKVMEVCYNQGWAASPSEMYAIEAAKVTSIGTAFQSLGQGNSGGYGYDDSSNTSFTFSFDEFKYFIGVDSIVNNAFSRSNIVSITIPNSVTSIGEGAFSNCSNLTSITIPDSVTSISYSAFDGCDSLVENNLRYADRYLVGAVDKSLSTYTIKEGTKRIGVKAFNGCSSLTSITIPNSVTSIGEGAFSNCSNLTSITISNSVTSIRNNTFDGCSSLTSITISNSVTSIGKSAFWNCSSLTSITIPDSVTSIGTYAFYNCSSLTSITISNSVTSIGESTFDGCTGLTSINIPDSVTSIGRSAFGNCYSLTSITIPDSVTSITAGAFSNCDSLPVENNLRYADTYLIKAVDKSLSTYTIKEGTKWIGVDAFFDCSSLTSITIPDSVTSIEEEAFYNCSSLTSITIPNSVTSIGKSAFWNCSSLTSITIPDSVTSIGGNAFYGCSNLNEITCLATTAPSITSVTFYNIKSNGILRVPSGSDYSSWMSTGNYYLGKYNWTRQEI